MEPKDKKVVAFVAVAAVAVAALVFGALYTKTPAKAPAPVTVEKLVEPKKLEAPKPEDKGVVKPGAKKDAAKHDRKRDARKSDKDENEALRKRTKELRDEIDREIERHNKGGDRERTRSGTRN